MSSYNVNIFATFPTQSLIDPQQPISDYGVVSFYLNTTPLSSNQTCSILQHTVSDFSKLAITSNGINDGNFEIYPIKYVGEKINFVAQLIDLSGYDVKDYELLILPWNLMYLSLSAADSNLPAQYIDGVSFYTDFGSLSTLQQGGFYKGYLVSPITANNVCIKAVLSTTANLFFTGYSSTFSIYSSAGEYNIRKVNEDFDQTAAYKSLAIQPVLQDKTQLFDGFLGQIVGNANSDPNTLGIETFEKISNFVSNTQDIDYCNLNQLKSLLDMINATYQDFNYQYPPSLRRLADILSVKHKKLFGQTNQYQFNFNNKGFVKSTQYGLNKGDLLDFSTHILSAGNSITPNYIVAYEKFGEVYTVVNTNLLNLSGTYLTTTSAMSTYPLSAIADSWGWNLVLPNNTTGTDITNYYDFYEFVPGVQGSLLQKFIDFDNPNNTLSITNSSYSDFVNRGGIMDNILLYNLYTGLEVLSSP